jgi:hypothetical protein
MNVPARRPFVASALLLEVIVLVGCQKKASVAVVNWGNNSVTEYALTANGNVAPSAALSGSNTGLDLPFGIASDSVGSLRIGNGLGGFQGIGGSVTSYVSGASGDSAPIATIAGATGLTGGVSAVALDGTGNIYAVGSSFSNQEVTVYARGATGDMAPIATIIGSNTGLVQPVGIGIDGAGKIYVANFGGTTVDSPSVTVYGAGANGNVAPVAKISGPNTGLAAPGAVAGPVALAVDTAGTVYVASYTDMGRVNVFAPGANGNVFPQRTISGSNTGMFNPLGIAVDTNGNIYVSNTGLGHPDTILVYGPGANGNVAPQASISGNLTGLDMPGAMIIVPPDP